MSFSIRLIFIFGKEREERKNERSLMQRSFPCELRRRVWITAIRKSLLCKWNITLKYLLNSEINAMFISII
ncbi:hypothetical protein D3C81_1764740 [compost metagenome]